MAYACYNKWVGYSYLLKTAAFVNKLGNTRLAFNIATGGKYKLPESPELQGKIRDDFVNLSLEYNLPSMLYFFALDAYSTGNISLFPKLLDLSIKMDPDFSFWRVELANYYLNVGDRNKALEVISKCVKLLYPGEHCQDYLDNNFIKNSPQDVGFLAQPVKQINQEKTFR